MSIIVALRVPAHGFALGRAVSRSDVGAVELETIVLDGEDAVPLFWVSEDEHLAFESVAASNGAVTGLEALDVVGDHALYALRWTNADDAFITALTAHRGDVLSGTGTTDTWRFDVRFPSRENLNAFHSYCDEVNLPVGIEQVFNPTAPSDNGEFGLTDRQRKTLELAVERGYYDIPRRCTTLELADELGISDQAVTERLRRGIAAFVSNTLLRDE